MTRMMQSIRLLVVLLLAATVVVVGAGRLSAQETPTAEPTEEVEGTAAAEETETAAPADDELDEATPGTPADAMDAATPTAATGGDLTGPEATAGEGRPVHIHIGTCDELGEVVAPLTDLLAAGDEGADGNVLDDAAGTPDDALDDTGDADDGLADLVDGPSDPIPVEVSVTTVDIALDELLAADHAINAHLSYDEIDTYVACGDIGGERLADGAIAIGLRELEGSGFAGIAYLAPNAGDPSQTDVSVFLAEDLTDDDLREGIESGGDDEKADDQQDEDSGA